MPSDFHPPTSASHPGLSFGEARLELLGAGAVDLCDGLLDRVDESLVDHVGAVRVVDGDKSGRRWGQRGVHLLPDAAFEAVLGELAHHAAYGGSDGGRG